MAGLAAWLWFVAVHLRKAAKNWLRPGVAPVTLALVSYLAHAAISIRVSMIFPEIMLLFALLQVLCLPPEEAQPEPAAKKRDKRQSSYRPNPSRALCACGGFVIVGAVVMMAVCGGASRVIFGFLY